jgi:branched-chain amino acid transport system permease protein
MGVIADWFDANAVSILNGVAIGLLLFTMAVGLSLIFGLMDLLNLAHGAIFALASYVTWQLVHDGLPFLVGVPVALGIGLLLGAGLALASRPIAARGHLDQALLTLGMAFVGTDSISWYWGNEFRSVRPPGLLRGSVSVFGDSYPEYRLAVIGIGLALAATVYVVFERTRLGSLVKAAVQDRQMVAALGVNVTLVLTTVAAIGAALAAFGGVIGAPILNVRAGLDAEVLILALIVVVVGGLGSIRGALVGALLIGQVQALGVALLPELASFLLFGAMALVLVFRPEGLFGEAAP